MPELTVDLGLTEEQMAELIHAAILEKIGPEQRDKIIGEALTFLITPKTQYDPLRGPEKQISPLMYAFQAAMNRAMQSAVEELLIENKQVQARLREMVGEVVTDFLTKPESDAMGRAKETLGQAFAAARY